MAGRLHKGQPASKLKISRRKRGMTVVEAGRLGGLIGGRKGGLAVKAERGIEFFSEIGKLGGKRVRDLIAAGRRAQARDKRLRAARGTGHG